MNTSSLIIPNQQLADGHGYPQTPLAVNALNALKNLRSAPVSGAPKSPNMRKYRTTIEKSRADLWLLDLFVDDGTDGGMDKLLRSLRFSLASANVERLFSYESENTNVGSGEQLCFKKDELRHTSEKTEETDKDASLEADGGPELFQTEPVTPPTAAMYETKGSVDSNPNESKGEEKDETTQSMQNEPCGSTIERRRRRPWTFLKSGLRIANLTCGLFVNCCFTPTEEGDEEKDNRETQKQQSPVLKNKRTRTFRRFTGSLTKVLP